MPKRKNTSSTSFGSSKWQKIVETSSSNSSDDTDEDEGMVVPGRSKRIGEKLKTMINSPVLADLKLLFNGDSTFFYAHTLILSVQSSVFAQMIRDTRSSSTTRAIVIQKFSPTIFQEILKFCYTDTADLNRVIVHDVMACANAYEIKELEDLCCQFCLNYLNISNACELYEHCFMFDNELSRKCLNILCEHILPLIDTKKFFVMNKTTVMNVLQSNALNVAEYDLFNAVHRRFGDIAIDNQRDVLTCIRFGVMSTDEISNCFKKLAQMNIPANEITAIIKSSSGIKRSIFVNESIALKYYTSSSNPQCVSFEFKVAKNVKIKSFYLDDHHVSCDYALEDINDYIYYGLRFKSNEKIIFECFRTTYFATPVEPIVLKPNTTYILDTWASSHSKKLHCKCNYVLYQFPEKRNDIINEGKGKTYVSSIYCSVYQS